MEAVKKHFTNDTTEPLRISQILGNLVQFLKNWRGKSIKSLSKLIQIPSDKKSSQLVVTTLV